MSMQSIAWALLGLAAGASIMLEVRYQWMR